MSDENVTPLTPDFEGVRFIVNKYGNLSELNETQIGILATNGQR